MRETSQVTAMNTGSNKCDQGGFDTPIISGSPKGLRDGGGQGHVEPAVSRPATQQG